MFDISEKQIAATAQAIERATGITVWPDLPPIKEWVRPLQELSDRFNRLKSSPNMYQGRELETAYCLYFFPVNVIRVLYVLEQLAMEDRASFDSLLAKPSLTVWDIGCGPGTASFAFSILTQDRSNSVRYVLSDANSRMLALADAVLRPVPHEVHPCSFERMTGVSGPTPDVIFMVNTVNEIDGEGLFQSLDQAVRQLKQEGYLIFIEPALRPCSRKLLEVRDRLTASHDRDLSLIYPCTHRRPCPILRDPENWCYMSCVWNRPAWIAQFDKHLGLNKRELDFTPIVFRKSPPPAGEESNVRIVSDLTSRKWGWECYLCGRDGLQKTVLRNKAAKKLKRGSCLSPSNLEELL